MSHDLNYEIEDFFVEAKGKLSECLVNVLS